MADATPVLEIPALINLVRAKLTNAVGAPIAESFMKRDIKTATEANATGTDKDKREAAAALRTWLQ